jgi:hypothetical protein
VNAEGWYVDPYQHHEARWFSDGRPTALVRDGGVESHDAPPSTPYGGQLESIAENPAAGPDDLRRADSNEGPVDPHAAADAVWEVFDETSGGD